MQVPPNHALQRTRPSRSGCNRTPSWAGSLSLGRSAGKKIVTRRTRSARRFRSRKIPSPPSRPSRDTLRSRSVRTRRRNDSGFHTTDANRSSPQKRKADDAGPIQRRIFSRSESEIGAEPDGSANPVDAPRSRQASSLFDCLQSGSLTLVVSRK